VFFHANHTRRTSNPTPSPPSGYPPHWEYLDTTASPLTYIGTTSPTRVLADRVTAPSCGSPLNVHRTEQDSALTVFVGVPPVPQ